MNKTILKFEICELKDFQRFESGHGWEIEMPEYPSPIHVAVQNGVVSLWAKINPEVPRREYRRYIVSCVGTGYPMPELKCHSLTCQGLTWHRHLGTIMDGEYVWHLFIELEIGTMAG